MGAVSEMDSPKKPNAEAKELDRRYFCGITDVMLAADRKAMCSVTAETIRAEAADLADRMANATRVAFGSKDAVEAGKQLFDRIETLSGRKTEISARRDTAMKNEKLFYTDWIL